MVAPRALVLLWGLAATATSTASDLEGMSPDYEIAGIPVYHYADGMVGTSSTGKQTWNVLMKESAGDMGVSTACSDAGAVADGACQFKGHPGKGGLAFTVIRATESELEEILKKHPENVELIEPSLPVYLPPHETHVSHDENPLNEFGYGSEVVAAKEEEEVGPEARHGLIALDVERTNGHYVICFKSLQDVSGLGPYRSYQQAETAFILMSQQCSGGRAMVTLTANHGLQSQKCSGSNCNNDPYMSGFRNWWECKLGRRQNCEAPTFGLAPSPPRRRRAPVTPRRRRVSGTPRRRRGSGTPPRRRRAGGTRTDRWGLDRIDQGKGASGTFGPIGLDGSGVHVYVVDTGIRTTHNDFGGRAVPTIETDSGVLKNCNADPIGAQQSCALDENGHGSHCAGTVAGKVSGVAPGAKVYACKVMKQRVGYTSKIAMAVDWIAKNHNKPAVISMSLGAGGKSVTMKRAIQKALEAGVLSVVAGGNLKAEACSQTPAHVPNATTVGATAQTDARASYSNYGSCTDIWAPGDQILSVSSSSDTSFRKMSGTSMATPHVAGAAALMLQANPTMAPLMVDAKLKEYATKDILTNLGTGSPNLFLLVTKYAKVDLTPRRRKSSGGSKRRRRRAVRRRKSSGGAKRRRRRRR